MATSFTTIYEYTIAQINDSFAMKKYNGSKISMYQSLQSYLMAAIPEFNIPISIITHINDVLFASGQSESFSGDGIINLFKINTVPLDNSIIEVVVNGSVVYNYTYNSVDYTITFSSPPSIGTDNIVISWYFAGQFNNDLSPIEVSILSDLMVWKWTLKEKNNIADIRRLLRDTDYQLWSEDKTMSGKANLSDIAREKAFKSMNRNSYGIYKKNLTSLYGLPDLSNGGW